MKINTYLFVGIVALAVLLACIWGCAGWRPSPALTDMPGDPGQCRRALAEFDRVVRSAGAEDTQAARICGYPYLRADRFMVSFKDQLSDDPGISEWIRRAGRLGSAGRSIELSNLPCAAFKRHYPDTDKESLGTHLKRCADQLAAHLAAHPQAGKEIIQKAEAHDDYRTCARVLGLYPVSGCVVLSRVEALIRESEAGFQRPEKISSGGNTYVPPGPRPPLAVDVRRKILEEAARKSALGIPEPDPADLKRLFEYFAPVWHVLPYPESDRIGRPYWQSPPMVGVDTTDPVIYLYHGFTRFDDDILLQLNYVIWFPSRPAAGIFDIYSGNIDGINWRVTLSPDGRVLLYDSIHCCGCFHKYFPVAAGLKPLSEPDTLEPPLILEENIPDNEAARVVIHLSERAHYIVGLTPCENEPAGSRTYRCEPYDQLRRLPLGDGTRSMFAPDGIVEGSERMERWILWPMGVPSPGAMRQQGHHAIALVGRQYFDEPRLLESVFAPSENME